MLPLLQMRQDQPLPVPVQHILAAHAPELQAASSLQRFEDQMHLRIVPEGFKVADALHDVCDRLAVHHTSLVEGHIQSEALADLPLQDPDLHLSHKLHMKLAKAFPPDDMKLRLLLFQLT